MRHPRRVNQITYVVDVQSKHNYLIYLQTVVHNLPTTCFGLYIRHHQVVLLTIKDRLSLQE